MHYEITAEKSDSQQTTTKDHAVHADRLADKCIQHDPIERVTIDRVWTDRYNNEASRERVTELLD